MQNSIGKSAIVTVLIGLLLHNNASAQSKDNPVAKSGADNSPYSQFGIGTLSLTPNAALRGMGGTGAGYNDEFSMNPENPASYSFLKVTTFDVGFEAKSRSVSFENLSSSNSFTGGMGYLGLVFPIKKFGGFAFGMKPVSNVFYQMADSIMISDSDKVRRSYTGNGGLQNAYLGLSTKIKNFSIGINAGYTFGSLSQYSNIYAIEESSARGYESGHKTNYGGFDWNAGLMYYIDLKKNRFLNIGLTYSGGATLSGTRNGSAVSIATRYDATLGREVILNIDTISTFNDAKGNLVLPSSFGFGFHGGKKDVLDINADFKMYNWSNFKKFDAKDSVSNSSFRMSAGASYTPDAVALYTQKGSYFSAVTYRVGFYYVKDYVHLRNTDINDIGGSFGMSFPLKRTMGNYQVGKIHTSFNIGNRGTIQNGLARELYVNFTVGASLSDIWFIKPLYE